MNLLIYSDLHLEFNNPFKLLDSTQYESADVIILAGDIFVFNNPIKLKTFLEGCSKPVLFVAGNHEYYNFKEMSIVENAFDDFIQKELPFLKWLKNDIITMKDLTFFGGTMWTDFSCQNPIYMNEAQMLLNDYRYILQPNGKTITADFIYNLHMEFVEALKIFLCNNKNNKRVIITHHSPVNKENSKFSYSKLTASFNSLDMLKIINEHQPNLWIYGHTHESDDQYVGNTRIVSNPFGYFNINENAEFKKEGLLIEI